MPFTPFISLVTVKIVVSDVVAVTNYRTLFIVRRKVTDMQMDIRNFHLSVDIRFEGGHPVKGNGLVFRGSEDGFYLFDLSPDGFYALYKFDGGFEIIIEKKYIKLASQYEENRIEVAPTSGIGR